MGRQVFQDGPYIDPPITAPAAYSTTTIAPLWPAASWTPIYANDPKAGKIYCVRAGGIITMSVATCTMLLTPKLGTGGTSLGAGPAQLLPVMTNIPWFFQGELVWRFIGVSTNSKAVFSGAMLIQGTLATAGAGTVITCGSTADITGLDATILSNIEINTTLGGTTGSPSIQTLWAYIFSRN